MSAKVECSECGGSCVVDDSQLGGKVKCPRCGRVFVATRAPEPARATRSCEPERPASARREAGIRRRRIAVIQYLLLLLVSAGALAAVAWYAKEQGVWERLTSRQKQRPRRDDLGLGPGFHIMPDEYWQVFDDPKKTAKPAGRTAADAEKPSAQKIDAEGLAIHDVKVQGPYFIVNDMGGLVPSAVGVWVSPNKLGQGKEAFYLEPGEEVTVTHWVCNFGGFKVFRVLNSKKRPGPRGKVHEAGWILGLYLQDKEGEPVK